MARTKNKADKIRSMLAKGKTVAEIIKATGATPSYIYTIKSKMRATTEHSLAGSTGIAAVKRTGNVETGIGKIRLEPGVNKPEPGSITITHDTPPPARSTRPQLTLWQRIKRVLGWQ